MEVDKILHLVKKMREEQKKYFSKRLKSNLEISKRLEKKVDLEIKKTEQSKGFLFKEKVVNLKLGTDYIEELILIGYSVKCIVNNNKIDHYFIYNDRGSLIDKVTYNSVEQFLKKQGYSVNVIKP